MAPSTENNQKSGLGRSPPRRTAKIAVLIGNNPKKTMECAELTCCRAKAVKSGNPMSTPNALTASADMLKWSGVLGEVKPEKTILIALQLWPVHWLKKMGLKSATATRVAGKDPAKIATPINPFTQQLVTVSLGVILLSLIAQFEYRPHV